MQLLGFVQQANTKTRNLEVVVLRGRLLLDVTPILFFNRLDEFTRLLSNLRQNSLFRLELAQKVVEFCAEFLQKMKMKTSVTLAFCTPFGSSHFHSLAPWATQLLMQWNLQRFRTNGSIARELLHCTYALTPSTKLDRSQASCFSRESNPLHQPWWSVFNQRYHLSSSSAKLNPFLASDMRQERSRLKVHDHTAVCSSSSHPACN